ncbi:MAG: hypothetical protein HYW45_01475 [Candidatus Daviesbacteria bacterium]|nr:MAG: hypothetical protein HYW45_01475 [Candidatus Daviesbacteria bacterium]
MNNELKEIYEADQNDQPPKISWEKLQDPKIAKERGERIHQRMAKTRELIDKGELKEATDYYHAAMVFQHGQLPEDFKLANELAIKAMELDPDDREIKWLYAASLDRYLLETGQPQKYGTQFQEWKLRQPIDPNITDEERAKYGVPPLAEAEKRIKEKYGIKD